MTKKKNNLPRLVKKVKADKVTTCNCNKAVPTEAVLQAREKEDTTVVESVYHIDTIYGSRFEMTDGALRRHVVSVDIVSNKPDPTEAEYKELVRDARARLDKAGYYVADIDAVPRGYVLVEECLDRLRHDIIYGRACKDCVVDTLNKLVKSMHDLTSFVNDRLEIILNADDVPLTLPGSYAEDYEIVNRRLVKKSPELKEVHTVKCNLKQIPQKVLEQLPAEIQKLIKGAPALLAGPVAAEAKALPDPADDKKKKKKKQRTK